MKSIEKTVQEQLFAMQDLQYKEFHAKLIPTVEPDLIIGVRTPELRKYAKQFAKAPEAAEFIRILPHHYYEENNLHAFIIETIKDFDAAVAAINTFFPYVDNWATCDFLSPKIFARHLPEVFEQSTQWIHREDVYTIRFGIRMFMNHFLDGAFDSKAHELVAGVHSEEYYVNMMIAWYFATALAKQYEATLPYIENKRLDDWTHNKAIQKAVESYRITNEQKAYLRSLKVKKV